MIYLFLAEGFEEIEAWTPVDILRRAGLDVRTVSIGADRSVRGAHGITTEADILFEESDYADASMLILPGGMPGTTHLRAFKPLCDLLLTAHDRGVQLAAICAAPMILGELGLLRGKEAICYPGFEDKLIGARLSDKKVVLDGGILTAAGMGVALDFALTAVQMHLGGGIASRIAASVMK